MKRARFIDARVLATLDAAELRDALLVERAARETADAYVEKRGLAIVQLEEALAIFKARCADLADEVKALRDRPPGREKPALSRAGGVWHPRIGPKGTGISPTIRFNNYPDGRFLELFIELDEHDRDRLPGAAVDAAAMAFSVAVQRGESVESLAWKWVGLRGGPSGAVMICVDPPTAMSYAEEERFHARLVRDPEVWSCTSLLDAIGKRLLVRYCKHKPFVPDKPEADDETINDTEGATP